jgi:hypothetical protein
MVVFMYIAHSLHVNSMNINNMNNVNPKSGKVNQNINKLQTDSRRYEGRQNWKTLF